MSSSRIAKDLLKQQVIANLPADYKVIFSENDNAVISAYAINNREIIGSGSYGVVYLAYPVDLAKLKIDESKKLAVKKIRFGVEFNLNEVALFKRYYKTSELVLHDSNYYLVMTYLDGDDLYQIDQQGIPTLSNDIAALNFGQRIALIQNIIMFVDMLHHETPSTGAPLAHSDLKGSNIRAKIVKSKNGHYKYDVYLLDFGIASEMAAESNQIQEDSPKGTPIYMPIEVFKEKRGLKSDIYALAAIFITLLGAKAPFRNKMALSNAHDEQYTAAFCLDGIFTGYQVPEFDPDVLGYLRLFLFRMQSNDYRKRPDTDQVLRFFTTLNNYCEYYHLDPDSEDNYVRVATLALLASGWWEMEWHKNDNETFQFSFEKVSLDSHLAFCIDVVLNTQLDMTDGKLSFDHFKALLAKHQITPEKSEPDVILIKRKPTLTASTTAEEESAIDKVNAARYSGAMPDSLASLFAPPPPPTPCAESTETPLTHRF
jgi:serine/threonine protein kinase